MNNIHPLNLNTISHNKPQLSNSNLQIFDYDPNSITTGIVHIGFGNFHRSHLAVYIDQILAQQPQWAIFAVDFLESDRQKHHNFHKQDNLYSVTSINPSDYSQKTQVIGSIKQILLYDQSTYQSLIDVLLHHHTQIISLTVTEKGYHQQPNPVYNTQSHHNHYQFILQLDHQIQTDIDDLKNTQDTQHIPQLKTYLGVLVHMVYLRAKQNKQPVTFMSCDNLAFNGVVINNVIAQMLQLSYGSSDDYPIVEKYFKQCKFPNSLVDRIVPRTQDEYIEYVRESFGIEDQQAIRTETFNQWIIEDQFITRPVFHNPNIIFVEDAVCYQQMKQRILNGCHSLLALIGEQLGYQYIHQIVGNNQINGLAQRYLQEISCSLDHQQLAYVDINQYIQTVLSRFSNQLIKDTVQRVSMDSYNKIQEFVIPSVVQLHQQGHQSFRYSGLIIALFINYQKAVDVDGNHYHINDPAKQKVQQIITKYPSDYTQIIVELFGHTVGQNQCLVQEVESVINTIAKEGFKVLINW